MTTLLALVVTSNATEATHGDVNPNRGDFTSRNDLAGKITKVIDTYNHTAGPFRWTSDAKLLKATRSPNGLTRHGTS